MADGSEQRLLEAAERIFADKGYKAASVREICKQAGVNIAGVNYYFGDKERLYIEAVKNAYRGCTEGAPFPEWHPDTPPVQKLRDFIRVMVTRMHSPLSPSSLQLMMREMAQPTAACVEVVRNYIRPIAQKLGGILAELLPRTTNRQRVLAAFSIVGQCLFYRNHRAMASLLVGEEEFRQYDVELIADHIVSFTLRALGVEDGAGSPAPLGSPSVQGVKP